MKYTKASGVLPESLIAMIQDYIDGGYLYIPRKDENVRKWGETSGSRGMTSLRNEEIFNEFYNGTQVSVLSKRYFLSEKTIRNIVSKENNKRNKQ
jgi:Mor family transcriptional regulator